MASLPEKAMSSALSWKTRAKNSPSRQNSPSGRLLDRTRVFLPFRGFPPGIDSRVFRPMISVFPSVSRRKCLRSEGMWYKSPPFLPMARFLSTTTIAFIFCSLPVRL